jgi:hypothetical protein
VGRIVASRHPLKVFDAVVGSNVVLVIALVSRRARTNESREHEAMHFEAAALSVLVEIYDLIVMVIGMNAPNFSETIANAALR